MHCELCGKPLSDEAAYTVRIEGVLLTVCSACAKHGEIVRAPQPKRVEKKQDKPVSTRSVKREVVEEIIPHAAEVIRTALQREGKPLEEIAKRLGVKESSLRAWEQGRRVPSIDEARRLEKALHIRLVETIVLEETPSATADESRESGITLGDIVTIKRRKKA